MLYYILKVTFQFPFSIECQFASHLTSPKLFLLHHKSQKRKTVQGLTQRVKVMREKFENVSYFKSFISLSLSNGASRKLFHLRHKTQKTRSPKIKKLKNRTRFGAKVKAKIQSWYTNLTLNSLNNVLTSSFGYLQKESNS